MATDASSRDPRDGLTPARWQVVKRVFQEALDRPPQEWKAYLDTECGDDEALRQEVVSLLKAHEAAESFLGIPPAPLDRDSNQIVERSMMQAGQTLGRYRILGLLGAGGMGQVYLAEDPMLGRSIALKLLPRAFIADPNRLRRFRQEARAASALSHANVCVVYEIGEAKEGRHYIAMEHVPGESLRQLLERHRAAGTRLALPVALDIAQQVASGLAAAHAAGVVHRDIKPENVMVRPDGVVKILDFGLAKLSERDRPRVPGSSASVDTEPGMVFGTVKYMSPEQARGLAVDGRTDVWSLGVIVYEMVSGQAPFDGQTVSDVMVAVLERNPPPLRALASEAPRNLDDVIAKALTKQVAERYQRVEELGSDLARVRDAVTAGAEASRTRTRLQRPSGRVIAGLAAAVLTVGLGTWFAGDRGNAAASSGTFDQKHVVAIMPFLNLSADSGQAYFASGIGEEITTELSRLSALRVLSRSAIGPLIAAPDRLRRLATELGVGSVVEGSVRVHGDSALITTTLTDVRSGTVLVTMKRDRALRDALSVQAEVARSIAEALQTRLTPAEMRRRGRPPTVNLEAYELYLRAMRLPVVNPERNRQSMGLLRRAIALDSGFARARFALAWRYLFLAYGRGAAYIDSGMTEARATIAADPELPHGYFAVAGLQAYAGRFREARAMYLKALELNPSWDAAMQDLAWLEELAGRYDEALHWATRAFPLAPNSPNSYYHVESPLLRIGTDSANARDFASAVDRFPNDVRLGLMLARLDILLGRDSAALTRARQVLARNPSHQEARYLMAELATITSPPDAMTFIEPLVRDEPEGRGDFLAESYRTQLGWLLAKAGDRAAAESLWAASEALARRQLASGNENPALAMELAAISTMRGDHAGALAALEQSYRMGWKDARILGIDPFFASLRQDSQFRKLTARMMADVETMRRAAGEGHLRLLNVTR